MKLIQLFVIGMSAALLSSCGQSHDTLEAENAKEVSTPTNSSVSYSIPTSSVVAWEGFKPTGSHTGTFNVKSGEIVSDGNAVTGGTIVMDMTTLKITDGTTDVHLPEHLKSADFFNVDSFPTSTFTITSVAKGTNDSSNVTGNLELKGVSKSITFPAMIQFSDSTVHVATSFFINRTEWGLVYGNDKSLGDKFIKPEVKLSFDITANKK